MDELFGNSFGDDLFEENKKKPISVVESYSNWSPHQCEPKVQYDVNCLFTTSTIKNCKKIIVESISIVKY